MCTYRYKTQYPGCNAAGHNASWSIIWHGLLLRKDKNKHVSQWDCIGYPKQVNHSRFNDLQKWEGLSTHFKWKNLLQPLHPSSNSWIHNDILCDFHGLPTLDIQRSLIVTSVYFASFHSDMPCHVPLQYSADGCNMVVYFKVNICIWAVHGRCGSKNKHQNRCVQRLCAQKSLPFGINS